MTEQEAAELRESNAKRVTTVTLRAFLIPEWPNRAIKSLLAKSTLTATGADLVNLGVILRCFAQPAGIELEFEEHDQGKQV